MPQAASDPNSQSNPHDVVTRDIKLNLEVSFAKQTLRGTATLTVELLKASNKVVLDTSNLIIGSIKVSGTPAKWLQRPAHPIYGSALEITLPNGGKKGDKLEVCIAYSTSPRGSATQWLPPEQTVGKEHPYLFTQCQAIHARSLLPCQDTPSVKATYSASITCPAWATALMSALQDGPLEGIPAKNGRRIFKFKQPVALASYLIALAVGELEFRELSHRCRVWSEPSMVDAAAFDFSQTEDFLKAAESLTCAYQWQRYDLLCLPASFPYGGMENPCLTFVTPTLLSGDKSLASVVAHEIAHSWSGNLVTNATWEHFWLNEGLTRWLEARIVAKATGDAGYIDFDGLLGWERLKEDVHRYEEMGSPELSKLVPELSGIDPDDAFSSVPYEKGMAFLNALERRVGADEFGKFIKSYINHFAKKTVTSSEFQQYFMEHFHKVKGINQNIDWTSWLYSSGMPAKAPVFDDALFKPCWALADAWLACNAPNPSPADAQADEFASWSWRRRVVVFDRIEAETKERGAPLPREVIQEMEKAYKLGESKNAEMQFHWQLLCLRSGYLEVVPQVLAFVTKFGRMKFVRPLYRELVKTKDAETVELAKSTFRSHASFYHPICRALLGKDLGVEVPPPMLPSESIGDLSALDGYDEEAVEAVADAGPNAGSLSGSGGVGGGGGNKRGRGGGSVLLRAAGVGAVVFAVAYVVLVRRGRR